MSFSPEIDLICLDLDGTVVVYDEAPAVLHPQIVDLLNLAGRRGVRWCINSGRGVAGQMEIVEVSRRRGLRHEPDALLAGECLFYERREGGYAPVAEWNDRVEALLAGFHEQVQTAIEPRLRAWDDLYNLCEVLIEPNATAFFIEEDGVREHAFHRELEFQTAGVPSRLVSRNGGWFAIIPEGLGKGALLAAYQRRRQLCPSRTLAVGDHLNDLPMLDGTVAHRVACPGNAAGPVRAAVARAGGIVASGLGPEGTAEVLSRFLQPVACPA